ncbi:hypothetical protein C8R45DRAFT_932511 [Mycena sanguinolenta]|nr:hypothetical protein C8R45DRAFT_932511 [Mycena sanguinolenta]
MSTAASALVLPPGAGAFDGIRRIRTVVKYRRLAKIKVDGAWVAVFADDKEVAADPNAFKFTCAQRTSPPLPSFLYPDEVDTPGSGMRANILSKLRYPIVTGTSRAPPAPGAVLMEV